MRQFLFSLVVVITISTNVFAYSGGSGIQTDPYQIAGPNDWQQLMNTSAHWGKYFIMTADVNLAGVALTPIGNMSIMSSKFWGVFDGNDHKIVNAYMDNDEDFGCLFGYVSTSGKICNLGVEDAYIAGDFYSGGLAGINDGTITNCYITGTVTGYGTFTGGLVGINGGTIEASYAINKVNSLFSNRYSCVGGLVGKHDGIAITDCYAAGDVNGPCEGVGGLVGTFMWSGPIENCYATGNVTGTGTSSHVGGLVGEDGYQSLGGGPIINCYATGNVTGTGSHCCVGGLVGVTQEGLVNITDSYATGDVNSIGSSSCTGGLIGENNTGIIADCYSANNVRGTSNVGGLAGRNCYIITSCSSKSSVNGTGSKIGGLVGYNYSPITNCYSLGSVTATAASSSSHIGGLVGENGSTITDCYSISNVTANHSSYIGGLIGSNSGSTNTCFATGDINGFVYVGGLIGSNTGSVTACYATGSVNGSTYVGGLVSTGGTITACYATGDVNGLSYVGGLIGKQTGPMEHCYSVGRVTGSSNVGGLVGNRYSGSITACFWDVNTSGCTTSAGGGGYTTDWMQKQYLFEFFEWDFTDTWSICEEQNYPRLLWSIPAADFGCPDGVDFSDFALFTEGWMENDCSVKNDCNGADLDFSMSVDMRDLRIFCEQWLTTDPFSPNYQNAADYMVYIAGGTFQMGDSFSEGNTDERPVHSVTLDSFSMGKFEITNRQYCDFLNYALKRNLITVTNGIVYKANSGTNYPYCDTSTSSSYSQIDYNNVVFPGVFTVCTKGGRDMSKDPVVMVSWYGAAAYCNFRSRQKDKEPCYDLSTWVCDFSKNGYRLATEAEWEYASRGGLSGSRFPWTDPNITHSLANYWCRTISISPYDVSPTQGYHPTWSADGIEPYTSPVGSFAVNGYGLCDMAGNVWEFCNDWYGGYSSDSQDNPTGPATGTSRVCRSSSWRTRFPSGGGYDSRVACRYYYVPSNRFYAIGFRIVMK